MTLKSQQRDVVCDTSRCFTPCLSSVKALFFPNKKLLVWLMFHVYMTGYFLPFVLFCTSAFNSNKHNFKCGVQTDCDVQTSIQNK